MLSYFILPYTVHIDIRNLIGSEKVYHLRRLRTNIILPYTIHIDIRNLIGSEKVYHLRRLRTNICDSKVRRKNVYTKINTLYYNSMFCVCNVLQYYMTLKYTYTAS